MPVKGSQRRVEKCLVVKWLRALAALREELDSMGLTVTYNPVPGI